MIVILFYSSEKNNNISPPSQQSYSAYQRIVVRIAERRFAGLWTQSY